MELFYDYDVVPMIENPKTLETFISAPAKTTFTPVKEMEEKQEQSSASDNKPNPNLCEECNTEASKYKCPGCSLRTCSLACVNSHKQRTACSGKRPLTNVVPIAQFDDKLLLSDYSMLEDVKRIADSAKRMRFTLSGYTHTGHPLALKSLRIAAANRGTKLTFLPNGMSKRKKNKTYYNRRNKFISWTVEWRFHSTDAVLLDHGINENSTVFSVVEKHLKPGPWNHPLRQFCDQTLDSLKIFIRKYSKGQQSLFCQLDIHAPIREQLANIYILEYPVIHVFLPSHVCDFDVIKNPIPRKVEIKERSPHDYPSPKGVTFKEEEIEDAGSSDPRILDLSNEKRVTENQTQQLVHSPQIVTGAKSTGTCTRSCLEELAEIPDLDFDFETGFIDVYPDLTADAISDHFFDFDEILPEQKDVEDGELMMEEELEEGEIA